MAQITVKTNESKSYMSFINALSDEGYYQVGPKTFRKDGKDYEFVSYDHFNTTIYSVTLQEA